MKKLIWIALAVGASLAALTAEDIRILIQAGQHPAMAIPDFRGSGAAAGLMGAFNQTLWSDIDGAGLFRMAPKTSYPTMVPQQPSDFREQPAAVGTPRTRSRRELVSPPTGGGLWMSDWSSPPVSANYLAIGYTAVQNDVLVLYGWLLDLSRGTPANAQVIGKRYLGSVDNAGSRKVAHEFAADILAVFGQKSLFGTKIIFVSDRSRQKEVWMMDPDGSNQRQITNFRSLSIMPAIAPDSSKIAFTSYARGNPGIFVFALDPVRQLQFYNQVASLNETPDFTPDGKQIVYSSSASGWAQIYIANLDGSNLRRISSSSAIEVEPKVNPKTGSEMVFVSGRSGPQQIYRMNMDGADVERLTPGEGEAGNPSWNPNGQYIAFSWTQGYASGNFNVFIMDVATRNYTQLTHGEGRNENPSWAPDGQHLVFMSTRTGSHQIWTMLADGTQLKQLTTQGNNWTPVWGK
jgi:TolB protein